MWQCNRAFRALGWLLRRLVWVVATNYVDDYPLVEPEATAEGSVAVFEDLAALLGWRLKPAAPGQERPAAVFDALGAQFDLSRLVAEGAFVVGN